MPPTERSQRGRGGKPADRWLLIINRAVRSATPVGDGTVETEPRRCAGKNGDKRRSTRDDFRQESHIRDNMKEKFLDAVRSSIERFSRASEKGMSGRDERLLKEMHHLCCLIAERNNGTGIAALREIAQKLASLSEESGGHDELSAAIYNFGSGFALLAPVLSARRSLSSRKSRQRAIASGRSSLPLPVSAVSLEVWVGHWNRHFQAFRELNDSSIESLTRRPAVMVSLRWQRPRSFIRRASTKAPSS